MNNRHCAVGRCVDRHPEAVDPPSDRKLVIKTPRRARRCSRYAPVASTSFGEYQTPRLARLRRSVARCKPRLTATTRQTRREQVDRIIFDGCEP